MSDRLRFNATGYPFHLYSGKDALENLPRELARAGATRALLVCGQSVATRTNLVERVRGIIGSKLAGVYSGLPKDAPLDNVLSAVEAARQHQADLTCCPKYFSTRCKILMQMPSASSWRKRNRWRRCWTQPGKS